MQAVSNTHAHMAMVQLCANCTQRFGCFSPNTLLAMWFEQAAWLVILTKLKLHSFLVLFHWVKPFIDERREKMGVPRKRARDKLLKMSHSKAWKFRPWLRLEHGLLSWWSVLFGKSDMLTLMPRINTLFLGLHFVFGYWQHSLFLHFFLITTVSVNSHNSSVNIHNSPECEARNTLLFYCFCFLGGRGGGSFSLCCCCFLLFFFVYLLGVFSLLLFFGFL